MPKQWSTMYGDITSRLTSTNLARRLIDAGIDVQVRRWLDNDGGQYIRVLDADDFILSPVSNSRYRADAIYTSFQRLRSTTNLVSTVLIVLGIRHRFHVFLLALVVWSISITGGRTNMIACT